MESVSSRTSWCCPTSDLTDRQRANRVKKLLKEVDHVSEALKELSRRESRAEANRKRYRRVSVRMKWRVARARVDVSRAVRAIPFSPAIKQSFIEQVDEAVSVLARAQRKVDRLGRQGAAPARSKKKTTTRRPDVPGPARGTQGAAGEARGGR